MSLVKHNEDIINNSLEVDLAVVVGVVHPENVFLQLVRVRGRVALPHHYGKVLPVKLLGMLFE